MKKGTKTTAGLILLFAAVLLVGCNKATPVSNTASEQTQPAAMEGKNDMDADGDVDSMDAGDSMMGKEATDTAMAKDDATTMDEEGVKTIEIEAGSFYYKPNMIKVKKGDKVKLVIKSVDMMHNINIDELNVKSDTIKGGNTGSVEFTANKVGEFEMYCSVGQHRANGQVGTLVVEE